MDALSAQHAIQAGCGYSASGIRLTVRPAHPKAHRQADGNIMLQHCPSSHRPKTTVKQPAQQPQQRVQSTKHTPRCPRCAFHAHSCAVSLADICLCQVLHHTTVLDMMHCLSGCSLSCDAALPFSLIVACHVLTVMQCCSVTKPSVSFTSSAKATASAFLDIIHQAPRLLEMLPQDSLKALSSTCRNLRAAVHDMTTLLTIEHEADIGCLLNGDWPHLSLVIMRNQEYGYSSYSQLLKTKWQLLALSLIHI